MDLSHKSVEELTRLRIAALATLENENQSGILSLLHLKMMMHQKLQSDVWTNSDTQSIAEFKQTNSNYTQMANQLEINYLIAVNQLLNRRNVRQKQLNLNFEQIIKNKTANPNESSSDRYQLLLNKSEHNRKICDSASSSKEKKKNTQIGYSSLCNEEKKKKFACSHCSRSFQQLNALLIHIRVHSGEKPHKCSVCTKSFRQSCHLIRHKRLHTGERPYVCAINGCNQSFSSSTRKKRHAQKKHDCY